MISYRSRVSIDNVVYISPWFNLEEDAIDYGVCLLEWAAIKKVNGACAIGIETRARCPEYANGVQVIQLPGLNDDR